MIVRRLSPKELILSLPQQPCLIKIYFSVRASAKFQRCVSLVCKNRDARNAEVLPFVNTANLSNFARSVTVPHFAAILRGNGFAENAKGPRFVSMEGERQNARPAQIPQNLQVHTEPSDCRIHLSKFIFIIVHQALGQNSREKTLSDDASANGKAYVLRHMLLASAYSFAAGVSQQRCGTFEHQ